MNGSEAKSSVLDVPLRKNKEWAAKKVAENKDYFRILSRVQNPTWMWLGCSDSRVPADVLLGEEPGAVFVARNLGNVVSTKDLNTLSALEYGVTALKIKNIVVCGHYGCGAVKAALDLPTSVSGLVNLWVGDIRAIRDRHADELLSIADPTARANKLTEYNVLHGAVAVATSQCVAQAWKFGSSVSIHALVYDLRDGILREIMPAITGPQDLETLLQNSAIAPCTSQWYAKA